eukprot:tig00021517_g21991.t1
MSGLHNYKLAWLSRGLFADELTLEMVTEEERTYMWDQYAPERRARLNLGIRRRLAPLLDNDRRRIEISPRLQILAYSLLLTLIGSPIFYYGDEASYLHLHLHLLAIYIALDSSIPIGMGDNIWLPDRNGVRTPMQWDGTRDAGFSKAPPQRWYCPLIDAGAYEPSRVNVKRHMVHIAYEREHGPDRVLVVSNVSGRTIQAEVRLERALGPDYDPAPHDLFTREAAAIDAKDRRVLRAELAPYRCG